MAPACRFLATGLQVLSRVAADRGWIPVHKKGRRGHPPPTAKLINVQSLW